jgi:hypothetical protein
MKMTVILSVLSLLLLGLAQPAVAHELEPEEAGHPVKVAAHVLYPVGYVLYQGVARPAHWFVSLPGMRKLFGHDKIGCSKSSLAPDNRCACAVEEEQGSTAQESVVKSCEEDQ